MDSISTGKQLQEIVESYRSVRESYLNYVRHSEQKKESLVEFEEKFNEVLASLVSISSLVYGQRTRHDDRASSSVKARICRSIFNGTNKEFEKESSWSKVESFAGATEEFSTFLEDRAFWYESYETIEGMRESVKSYLTAITHRIKLRD